MNPVLKKMSMEAWIHKRSKSQEMKLMNQSGKPVFDYIKDAKEENVVHVEPKNPIETKPK